MIKLHTQFMYAVILISLILLGAVTVSLGALLTVFTLATAFVTYYPAVLIDWIIGKIFKK